MRQIMSKRAAVRSRHSYYSTGGSHDVAIRDHDEGATVVAESDRRVNRQRQSHAELMDTRVYELYQQMGSCVTVVPADVISAMIPPN